MQLKHSQRCWCTQFDDKFQSEGEQFVLFDFRKPEQIPEALHGSFDLLVIDPPFITREVWELYAQSARLLARPGAKILLSTIRAYNWLGIQSNP